MDSSSSAASAGIDKGKPRSSEETAPAPLRDGKLRRSASSCPAKCGSYSLSPICVPARSSPAERRPVEGSVGLIEPRVWTLNDPREFHADALGIRNCGKPENHIDKCGPVQTLGQRCKGIWGRRRKRMRVENNWPGRFYRRPDRAIHNWAIAVTRGIEVVALVVMSIGKPLSHVHRPLNCQRPNTHFAGPDCASVSLARGNS